MTLSNKRIKNVETFKKKTGNAPDVTYKDYPIKNKTITLIYANSVSSSVNINDFILRRLDEDKNNISLGIDVLIGTPERLNFMFGTAGFDVNQLKMFVIDTLDDLLRVRLEPKLYRLSESIGKTQRFYLSSSEYERLDTFVDKTMLDSFWFTNEEDEEDFDDEFEEMDK